jgi:hypothetical protein
MPLVAHVVRNADGHAIWIRDVRLRDLFAGWFFDEIFPVATFHLTCCRTPDWMYLAGFGRDSDPEEYRLPRRWSLGHLLFRIGQRTAAIGYSNGKQMAEIPVSEEFMLEHFPDLHVDLDGDAMHGKPSDCGEVRL